VSQLEQLVTRHYGTLSPSEMRLADLILGGGDLAATSTATELADEAGVSKPTVTRFVHKLGLESFREFRRLARDGRPVEPGSPVDLLQRELSVTSGDLGVLLRETSASEARNLVGTYGGLDLDELARVVDLLVGAREVLFIDFRKNHPLAAYAATLLNSLRPHVRSLPERGTSPADGLLDLAVSDVVVMFPFRRAQQDHLRTSEAVIDRGATLVTIGDRYPNPAAQRATVHLCTSTDGPGVFDSLTAAMSLIGLLATAVANRLGEAAQERLDSLEDAHTIFGTFVAGDRSPARIGEDRG
jgi:DNA-binding MurR/RpiR family transcriptional regulator